VSATPRLPASKRLGPYEIQGQLGAGGMGEVWLARDTRLEREVALKVLPARLTASAEALALFRNEALALASLNHPNIATIHGLEDVSGGTMVLVLELVQGESLAARLARAPLDVESALQIAAQVAQALEVAHERGVVHRDLKPGNIMIGPRGLVKVLDFGLAKRTHGLANAGTAPAPAAAPPHDLASVAPDRPATLTGPVAGTPGYMSPEQVLAGTQDSRTDVFAFGCVLYECLSGRRAFPADDPFVAMAQVLSETPDLAALPERTPPAIRALLDACLTKDAEARPRDMRALRFTLEEALGIRRAAALREGEAVATSHNLPAHSTSFIGRDTTVAECTRALAQTRLLTLTGFGGSGKTRLALRLAETQLGAFPDGVWFVDVAPLTEPERLVEALGAVLGVRDEAGRTMLTGVLAWLKTRRALVLFDNAETHAQACAALVTELLRGCPELKLLVTDREPLAVEGETLFTVPTLGVPAAGVRTAAAAEQSEAVRLFRERARAASAEFELTDANAATVAEICRRLDGIPLALELAAARVRLLGVEQIKARLGDRFKLLTRSGGGAPSRQQTVLAVIQWSWDHLLAPERDLFRRLAVFTGGWTLERATAVCDEQGDEFEVLDLLTRLAERSLVVLQRAEDGSVRYRFLESVWRFGLEQLETHLEHEALRERHLATYLAFAERAGKAMTGAGVPQALQELVSEEENILAAFAWCAHADDGVQRGLRLASAMSRFWSLLGLFSLGRRVLEEALARDTARTPTPVRSMTLVRASGFALVVGDHAVARAHLEESLANCRAAGDRKGIARALGGLGVAAMWQARYDEALAIGEESLAEYREIGEQRGVAMALHNLGSIESALKRPDHGRARMEAALELLRAIEDRATEALCLAGLAESLLRGGDLSGARTRLRECLALLEELDLARELFTLLEALAAWLFAAGRPLESARMMGAAAGIRTAIGALALPAERADGEQLRARIAAAIGEDLEGRVHAEGGALSREQALSEARRLLDSVQSD
jgi:non-specific serine/threonine protein kinase